MIGKNNEMQMKDYGGGRMNPRLGKKRVFLSKLVRPNGLLRWMRKW